MPDLTPEIEQVASEPKSSTSGTQSADAHSLPDLIEADKYLKGQDAVERKARGLRFTKLVPPGSA